jgi:hypothetical protein
VAVHGVPVLETDRLGQVLGGDRVLRRIQMNLQRLSVIPVFRNALTNWADDNRAMRVSGFEAIPVS